MFIFVSLCCLCRSGPLAKLPAGCCRVYHLAIATNQVPQQLRTRYPKNSSVSNVSQVSRPVNHTPTRPKVSLCSGEQAKNFWVSWQYHSLATAGANSLPEFSRTQSSIPSKQLCSRTSNVARLRRIKLLTVAIVILFVAVAVVVIVVSLCVWYRLFRFTPIE